MKLGMGIDGNIHWQHRHLGPAVAAPNLEGAHTPSHTLCMALELGPHHKTYTPA